MYGSTGGSIKCLTPGGVIKQERRSANPATRNLIERAHTPKALNHYISPLNLLNLQPGHGRSKPSLDQHRVLLFWTEHEAEFPGCGLEVSPIWGKLSPYSPCETIVSVASKTAFQVPV